MAQVELIMPKMGESVAEATIIKWLKQEGERIEAEEAVLEIATDKVDSEIPAPEAGILTKKLFKEDDVVKVGDAIAMIETEGSSANASVVKEDVQTEKNSPPPEAEQMEEEVSQLLAEVAHTEIPKLSNGGKFYSPLVRSIAEKEGISLDALEQIDGSGQGGRVTKADILALIEGGLQKNGSNGSATKVAETKAAVSQSSTTPTPASAPAPVNVTMHDGDEIIEMDRMRKLIANHMVESKHTSPHVTSMIEVDVTSIVHWRENNKNAFQKREGEKITYTPLFIEQIVKAIKDMPMINISVSGDKIIKRKHINIGMATALPSGNLIVPVIKDADQKNLLGLTKEVNDLANRARNNKLNPDEIQGGTFTITNVGTFGNVMGTPIINQPQVAIMALGAIRKKPAVIETPFGDTIGIRHMMFISMSYDHRVVDGSLGGSFIQKVADYLEKFDPKREW